VNLFSRLSAVLVLVAWPAFCAAADVVPETLKIDLAPLIESGARSPNRFAVDIPLGVTSRAGGQWSESNGVAVWRYAVRVPSAVSISFRAIVGRWPSGARLTVTSGNQTATYTGSDMEDGGFWSRVSPGDSFNLELTLPSQDRSALSFAISSVQAGYRSLTAGGPAHPRFRALEANGETAALEMCVENYLCHTDAANDAPSRSVVALIIGNQLLCTGTLLNNVTQDGTPFILTARHCQDGNSGGGKPQAARDVQVLWNATSQCGATLATVYSATSPRNVGATTRVEQQDAWLIELDAPPAVDNVYYAGWDATGATFSGGYTIHHGNWLAKQFTRWFGQAVAVTRAPEEYSVPYTSNLWALSNDLGSIAGGASGGPVFDANQRLVASLSRARVQSGSGSDGLCPANPPQPPASQGAPALATSFAAVFASTSDTSSTTGAITLSSVLGASSGLTTIDGVAPLPPPAFTASNFYPPTNSQMTLSWSSNIASSCKALGGAPGWSGTLPASGSVTLTEPFGVERVYSLECSVGTRKQSATIKVIWQGPGPYVTLSPNQYLNGGRWVGAPLTLSWVTNVPPCTISREGAADMIVSAPSGSFTYTHDAVGLYTVTARCGSGNTAAQGSFATSYEAPSVTFEANTSEVLIGEGLVLRWNSMADACTPAGGGPNPLWAGPTSYQSSGLHSPNETVAGTYTYELRCYSGNVRADAQVTVTFTNGPVTAVLSVLELPPEPPGAVVLQWRSNVARCFMTRNDGPVDFLSPPFGATLPRYEREVGTVKYELTCRAETGETAHAEASVTLTREPPSVTVVSSLSNVTVGDQFTVTWNATRAETCTADGDWSSAHIGTSFAGSLTFLAEQARTYTYNIRCTAVGLSSQASLAVRVAAGPPAPAPGAGSSSGGGGGGGKMEVVALLCLLLILIMRAGHPAAAFHRRRIPSSARSSLMGGVSHV
jgi:hypothetical protein